MLGFEQLSTRLRLYILAVFTAAVLQCLSFIRFPHPPAIPTEQIPFVLVIFSLLALLSELRPISTPAGDRKTVTASISLATLLLVGPDLTIVLVAVSQIGYSVLVREAFPKPVFNVSQLSLTAGLSGSAYYWLLERFGLPLDLTFSSPRALIALAVLILIYYSVNSILVAIVVALSQNRPVVEQYRDAQIELVNGVFAAEVAIGIITAMLWGVAPWGVVLVAFVVVVVYLAYSLSASLLFAQRDLLQRMSELQRRTAELELLNGVNAALTRALDLTELWEMLAEEVGRILDATCFLVALAEEEDGHIRIAFAQDGGTRSSGRVIPAGTGISGWVVGSGQPLLIHNYTEEADRLPPLVTWGSGKVPASVLAVPLTLDGRVLGVISAQTYRPDAYTVDDLNLLTAIASQAAVAINSAQLRREAAEAQALRQLSLLKTQFISTVSHELRSPLTPIVGYSEMLGMGGFSDGEVQEMATEINRSALHLQRLVEDILDLSRIESGQMRLDMQPTDIADVVSTAARDFANASPIHEVRTGITRPLPTVSADPVRLRQVLHNLIGNAVKYSPDGGTVLVRALALRDEVRVSVSDQGPGIPAERISRLFEMFYRVDSDLTRKVRGTGIGLAVCKHIVDSHGGRIWVESEVGAGSTFFFSLPTTETEIPRADPGGDPTSSASSRSTEAGGAGHHN